MKLNAYAVEKKTIEKRHITMVFFMLYSNRSVQKPVHVHLRVISDLISTYSFTNMYTYMTCILLLNCIK